MRAMCPASARRSELPDLPVRDFLHGHREVVLRAGLDQRGRCFLETDALTELVVVVVDLPGPLGGNENERVAGSVDLVEQIVETWVDHGREMVPARDSSHSTSAASATVARSSSSFRTMYRNSCARSSCSRARAMRSPISPVLSVARSRSRRSSSSTSAAMKMVMLPSTSLWTLHEHS